MLDSTAYVQAVVAVLALAVAGWLYSLWRDDVTIVDSLWGIFFVVALLTYIAAGAPLGVRSGVILALVLMWAARLSIYLAWRNGGKPEDRRYAAMRARNQPGFRYKSLYLVFLLQAVLASVIALPLFNAASGSAPWQWVDMFGLSLCSFGLCFESVADWQLARFRSSPAHVGAVLDQGLWRYTRHPNYFGECCVWWGFYLLALSTGGWWTALAPLLMSWLLLRISGVTLLEQDIAKRRPGYLRYLKTTNAFFPWRPRAHQERP